jgi:hypothetical protein
VLRIYRNNQLFTSIAVMLYFLLFFLSDFLQVKEKIALSTNAGYLLKSSLEQSSNYPNIVFFLLAVLLIFWINNFSNQYRLNKRPNFVNAITVVLCLYAFVDSGIPTAALLANIPILLAFQNIFKAYERKNSIIELYNAAFWVAIAALCYSPAIWYALFVLIASFQLRSFNIQEFFILLFGFLTPFFLLGTYLFLNDQLLEWWTNDFIQAFGNMRLGFDWTPINIIPLSWIGILLLWSLVNFSNLKQKTTIREQKYYNVLLSSLLISILSILGLKTISLGHWGLLLIPFSIFLSLNLQSLKNNRMAALIHWILWATVILTQWYQYL